MENEELENKKQDNKDDNEINKINIISEENSKNENMRNNSKPDNNESKEDNLKELMSFEIGNTVSNLILLKDGRLLASQIIRIDNTNFKYRIYIYNLTNNNNCDIKFDLEGTSRRIIEMEDGHIILIEIIGENIAKIKVINIKEKEIEITQNLEGNYVNICKGSNNKILVQLSSKIMYFTYEKGKLIDDNNCLKIRKKIYEIEEINENEIVIYCREGLLFLKDAIIFYDTRRKRIIKTLKMGYINFIINNNHIKLKINNFIIVSHMHSYFLIDVIKKEIQDEYNFGHPTFICLKENIFILKERNKISVCEIDSNNKFKVNKTFKTKNIDCLSKYKENKLIIAERNRICLYEYN